MKAGAANMKEYMEEEEMEYEGSEQWMRWNKNLGYLHWNEDGLVITPNAIVKLSALYHRVRRYAPWLLKKKNDAPKVRLRTHYAWVLEAICFLFLLNCLDDVVALTNWICGFIAYLGSTSVLLQVMKHPTSGKVNN